jgi:hypothetical protein
VDEESVPAAGGAPNGPSATDPFDRWYRYPAGFSPASCKVALDAVGVAELQTVVDPFAGIASVGTAAARCRVRFVGIEAHPQIAELACLKFRRPASSARLLEAAAAIVATRDAVAAPAAESEHPLVRRCFDEQVLQTLVKLRTAILCSSSESWAPYLKWALLGTLRDVAAVKIGWPYQRPALARNPPHKDPIKRFLQRVSWMAEDLLTISWEATSIVVSADSRDTYPWQKLFAEHKADASVASPPYFNNFDYADATRLELYFWRTALSWREMCENVRSGMIIATTQQTRVDVAKNAQAQLEIYPVFRNELHDLIAALAEQRVLRDRGKEYDRVLGPYFLGLARVLSNMFNALQPGAKCAWLIGDSAPYGVYVNTPKLIAALAEDLGYKLEKDVEIRKRGNRWLQNGVRHRVALSERLVVFVRP